MREIWKDVVFGLGIPVILMVAVLAVAFTLALLHANDPQCVQAAWRVTGETYRGAAVVRQYCTTWERH